MSYDQKALSATVSEKDLYIAYWDNNQWIPINDSSVDSRTNTVSGKITHFTKFTIIGPPPSAIQDKPDQISSTPPGTGTYTLPPKFEIPELMSITPGSATIGEEIKVSILVTNTGGRTGSYTLILKINDKEETRKELTIRPTENETATFTVEKEREGTYSVEINGVKGQFTVIAPPPPVTPQLPTAPTETPPPPTATPPVDQSINWGLIGSIIAGCIVAGLLGYSFIWRKRGLPLAKTWPAKAVFGIKKAVKDFNLSAFREKWFPARKDRKIIWPPVPPAVKSGLLKLPMWSAKAVFGTKKAVIRLCRRLGVK
jgi:hypothetical protein